MKNFIFLLATILFSNLLTAQIKSGKVIYKVKPPQEFNEFADTTNSNTKNQKMKDFFVTQYENYKIAAPYLSFTLEFNESEAIFSRDESMANDNGMDLKRMAIWTDVSGVYYCNAQKDFCLNQFEYLNKLLRVKDVFNDLKWQISNEYKTIGGYKCQKATATETTFLDKDYIITAWFCPDLPFHFGPKNFSGLPGLILGLKQNNKYLYADKISLSENPKTIKMPTKGKLMTKEAYDQKSIKDYKNMNKRYEELKK